ncbi:MAG TPA: hypothetical protein VFQ61_20105 [Polyangiaceae bacterium]|nr:hypothetical protein [Polyangiaceae bacterium]
MYRYGLSGVMVSLTVALACRAEPDSTSGSAIGWVEEDASAASTREARGGATAEAPACSLIPGETSCVAAFPRRILHECREEDTFLASAVLANALPENQDVLNIELVLAATDPRVQESPACAANFRECHPLSEPVPGYSPPIAECFTGQCMSPDIRPASSGRPYVWKLLNQEGAGTMEVELPPNAALSREWRRATAVILHHDNGHGWPQAMVLYWNGFLRMKTLSVPDRCFGSSFVLPPFLPVEQPATEPPRPELHPVIDRLVLGEDESGRPRLQAYGAWYDLDWFRPLEVEWTLVMDLPSTDGSTQWRVSTRITRGESSISTASTGRVFDVLGIGAISSMYSRPGSFDADYFEVDPGEVVGAASLLGPSGTTVNGSLQVLGPGSSMKLARSAPSDHNASGPDLRLTLVSIASSGANATIETGAAP